MAITLEKFCFCLELQLGGIIMAWWGMIISAISIVGVISGLLFGKGYYNNFFPFHVSTNGAVMSGVIGIILLLVYFYFSYQLLLGTQSVSGDKMTREVSHIYKITSCFCRETHRKCSAISSFTESSSYSSFSEYSAVLLQSSV